MTLDEAIEHAEEVATTRCGECAEEHMQLAEWLRELKRLKAQTAQMGEVIGQMAHDHAEQGREIARLERENTKLRELVHHMCVCMCNIVDADYECDGCPMDNDTQNCHFERRMEELGIEVEVGC